MCVCATVFRAGGWRLTRLRWTAAATRRAPTQWRHRWCHTSLSASRRHRRHPQPLQQPQQAMRSVAMQPAAPDRPVIMRARWTWRPPFPHAVRTALGHHHRRPRRLLHPRYPTPSRLTPPPRRSTIPTDAAATTTLKPSNSTPVDTGTDWSTTVRVHLDRDSNSNGFESETDSESESRVRVLKISPIRLGYIASIDTTSLA